MPKVHVTILRDAAKRPLLRMRVESQPLALLVDKRHGIGNAGARGPVAVDPVIGIRKTKRYAADHPPVVAELEMAPDQAGLTRQRRLRDRAKTERLRSQQEIADIGSAVDCAINAQRFIGVNDGDVRRAEEIVILKRLLRISRLVAARDAERVVKLEAAFPAALQIDAA